MIFFNDIIKTAEVDIQMQWFYLSSWLKRTRILYRKEVSQIKPILRFLNKFL